MPLLARVYPNGMADVNHFHAAGGMGFLIRELLGAGLLHEDVQTIMGARAFGLHQGSAASARDGELVYADAVHQSRGDEACCAAPPSPSSRPAA